MSMTCRSCLRALRLQTRHHSLEAPVSTAAIIRQSRKRSSPTPTTRLVGRSFATSSTPAAPSTPSTSPAKQPGPEDSEAITQTSDFAEIYVAKERSEVLFKECARQADYIVPQAFEREGEIPKNAAGEEYGEGVGWWYETCGLTPTFNTWFQITALHLYLITVRLRYLPHNRSQIWQQHLSDHFFYEAEHRMTIFHRITARAIRNRYLKDLYNQWRGVQVAYDEGLVKGDAVLATAVWRNIFKADENADWTKIAQITSYMRKGLKALDKTGEKTLLGAKIKFAGPDGEADSVVAEARGMETPFEALDEAQWAEWEKKKGASK